MVPRRYWSQSLEWAWQRRSVVWLSGARRVGKTVLCQSLPAIEYFDCELPRVRRMLDDPQAFLESLRGHRIILDEVHRLERRHSFQRFAELLMTQSGGIFEATKFARPCEVSRTTISNYLAVLETTFVVHVVRPFSTHRPTEIVSAPKVYGFDTGFVCYHRGWHTLRREDLGLSWEHFVLNEMHAHAQAREVRYWRDKRGHEVDFVLARRGRPPLAVECKWSASEFDPDQFKAFKRRYPRAESVAVAHDVERSFSRSFGDVAVRFMNLSGFIAELTGKGPADPHDQLPA